MLLKNIKTIILGAYKSQVRATKPYGLSRISRLTIKYSSILRAEGWQFFYCNNSGYFFWLPPEEIVPNKSGLTCSCYVRTCPFSGISSHYQNFVSFRATSECRPILVYIEYARDRNKKDWWWNKKTEEYTGYKFDYQPYDKYKQSPRFWKKPGPRLCFGHEFELRFKSPGHKMAAAKAIYDNFKPVICEKDGSLDEGALNGPSMEIITPPWGMEEIGKVESLFQLLARYGAHVPDDSYAWHCTVNCEAAQNVTVERAIHRLVWAINFPGLREFWKEVGRRDTSGCYKDYAKFENFWEEDDSSFPLWRERHSKQPVDHYYAAFPRKPWDSVELRFMKSTLDINVFSSTMETVQKVWTWADSEQPINNLLNLLLHPSLCA